ncbi:RusA family crossover junction endodeoxyribonuclease [Candidatus Margulisiibacteriota bacterium]
MYSSIVLTKPKSFNSFRINTNGGKRYKANIQSSFSTYNGSVSKMTNDLYGIVYYFFKRNIGIDADNLSKPIWDCLKGYLFDDDKQVKLRTAGCIDLTKSGIDMFDMTGVPSNVLIDLLDATDNENDMLYVECGTLNNSFYKFNIEGDINGN